MVLIPLSPDAPFCIDERQATYGEYGQFVKKMGKDFGGQPSQCDWNRDWGPVVDCESSTGRPWKCGRSVAEADPDWAVSSLDFCDAWAFCSWAGKRLCGERVHHGVSVFKEGRDDETRQPNGTTWWFPNTVEEWYHVCTQGGTSDYPFGNDWQDGLCQTERKWRAPGDKTHNVRDTTGNQCHGNFHPYDQVFNMIGGISQWTNGCSEDNDRCAVRGGYEHYGPSCSGTLEMHDRRDPAGGVRCCADAVLGYAGTQ